MADQFSENQRKWIRIFAVIIFSLVTVWFLYPLIDPDLKKRIVTLEMMGLVIIPLLLFYIQANVSPNIWPVCIVVPLFLWFFTYGLLHELSHLISALLLGCKVTAYQLMPRFWQGEVGVGWVQSVWTYDWRDTINGLSPYIRDIIFLGAGLLILKNRKNKHAFLAGFIFIIFCLSPLYDIVDNYFNGYMVAHAIGNDWVGTENHIGPIWTKLIGVTFIVFGIVVNAMILLKYSGKSPAGEAKVREAADFY
ncbi:MAG TPA: hypothetical protein VHY08_23795 [Bacillota bacterium]|nr:hypothetical protein [Bacillota bacterium]